MADPSWTPLLPTPNHPEYTAAHNCFSTAIATAIAAFFGTDKVTITVNSTGTGERRRFSRLSVAVASVIEARILAGVHFRFSAEAGATLGADVARYVASTTFRTYSH